MFPTSADSMSDRNRVNPISVGEPLHTSPENALERSRADNDPVWLPPRPFCRSCRRSEESAFWCYHSNCSGDVGSAFSISDPDHVFRGSLDASAETAQRQ